ncbi:MAG: alpha-amylase family glycosyl hydrolase, partial [Armatimonadota bacterium]
SNLNTADLTKPGQEYDLGTQYVSLRSGEWFDCLTAVRDMYKLHGFVARPTAPEWAKRAILYTMYPGGTMESGLRDTGGFNNVTQYTLPRIKALGCNTLWFLPICPGLYGPKDYYAIEPAIGTEADLHSCVAAAKTQGINVLLDLVPHGPDTSSPISKDHPDWVGKDAQGKPALWWGCTYCDYANRGWQKYMADVARYFVEKHGLKGWRVDCAPGGPANWDPERKVRASQSSMYGGLEVLKAAKDSMRQIDRETILLPEGTGPMLLENADIVYDYTMYFTIFKHFMDAESPDAWVKRTSLWLEQQRLSWPEGGCFGLMRFLENHDNVRYWRYAGLGPSRALMAMCAWIQGVPLYHHLQEVGSTEEFTRINTLRTQVAELSTGTARYLAAKADRPGVFTCLREDADRKALVVINLTGESVQTTIALPKDALPKGERLVAYEAWTGQFLNTGGKAGCAREGLRQLKVPLAAYQPALVLLRPVGASLPVREAQTAVRAAVSTAPAVTTDETGASLTAGPLGLRVSGGGLPSAITLGGTNVLASLDLAEGRAKPLGPGKGLSLARSGQATVTTTPQPARTITA